MHVISSLWSDPNPYSGLASFVVSTRDDAVQVLEKAVQLEPNSKWWCAQAVARALNVAEEIVAHDCGRQFRIQPDNS